MNPSAAQKPFLANLSRRIRSWKFWSILVSSILLIWLVLSLFLYSQASTLVFNNKVSWAPVPNYGYNLSFIKNSAGQNISVWEFKNTTSDKVILYLHGNAGRIGDFFVDLNTIGTVYSPAYPGYHESEGSPNTENVYEAAELTYNWLVNDKKIDPKKIIILGHSMGGSPAVNLASKHPEAKKLILVNTFSSVQSMCFRDFTILCGFAGDILNTAKYAPDVKIPVRHFVYKRDLTVPPEEGRKLFTYFKNSNDKKLIELDNYTHVYFDIPSLFRQAGE